MMTLTSQRDTDELIINKLNDFELINLCFARPDLWFNHDEMFWQKRVYAYFPLTEKEKELQNKIVTWKILYIKLLYCKDINYWMSPVKFNIEDLFKRRELNNHVLVNFLIRSSKTWNLTKRVREINSFLFTQSKSM
jgi:hypothetical protein